MSGLESSRSHGLPEGAVLPCSARPLRLERRIGTTPDAFIWLYSRNCMRAYLGFIARQFLGMDGSLAMAGDSFLHDEELLLATRQNAGWPTSD